MQLLFAVIRPKMPGNYLGKDKRASSKDKMAGLKGQTPN
jgi:hypothetical protein